MCYVLHAHVDKEIETMEVSSLSLSSKNGMPFQCLPLSRGVTQWRSSPPMQVSCRATKEKTQNVNFYELLSLSSKSPTMEDIKKAYRSKALQCHPDVCRDPSMKEELTRLFALINEAYETLSNPVLREEYDYGLGLRSKTSLDDEMCRRRWKEQISELKRRSHSRMARKDGSWGSRMRAQNMENDN